MITIAGNWMTFRKAPTALVLLMAAIACPQTAGPKQEAKPYTIQNDVLGESVADFQKNQKCVLKPDPDTNGLEGTQICIANASDAHYAGVWILGKTGKFYQGALYDISIYTSTRDCEKADMLSLLKEKYGEPKLTEIVNGQVMKPYVSEGDPPFKIWQNGKETIFFEESMGGLDACTIMFQLDALFWKVENLKQEQERKKKEASKKDM